MSRFFPNLVVIDVANTKFQTISAEDLQPFPNLVYLNSIGNALISLDGDLFKYTRKLKYLTIYDSQLQHVGYNLLTGLDDLQEADFRSNPCSGMYATTKEGIEVLNRELPISCPPLDTTPKYTEVPQVTAPTAPPSTPAECSEACLERIVELETQVFKQNSKNDKLSEQVTSQENKIEKLSSETSQLLDNLDEQRFRIYELENMAVEFLDQNVKQEKEIVELKSQSNELLQVNAMFTERIAELEKKMEELYIPII